MMDEIQGAQAAQRITTKKQVSLETAAPLQEVTASANIESIQAMRNQLQHGIQLMGEIRSQLERAYRELG